jgi:hypothetical protein
LNHKFLGIANGDAIGVQVKKEASKKKFRRVFVILQKHKQHNNLKNKKKNSQSNSFSSTTEIRREVNRAAKVITGLSTLKDKTKRLALRRLLRLHAST